ncbi:MAG: outer membrane beta-barrel protein [Lentisphaeria bacterium]|jgi:outer membrane beta-barrel protein
MENRIQRVFLVVVLLLLPCFAHAQDEDESERTVLDAVIEPDLDRLAIQEDKIDSENFEIGFFAGVISVEDFGTNNVFGYRMAYHISEDFFLEGAYGITEIGETTAETLFAVDIVGDDHKLDYYNMSLGINLFPGEIFMGSNYAFNADVYLILGAGNTRFGGDEFFTYNFGGGFRMYVTDWLAFRLDFRNHLLTHNVLGQEKSIQNLETHAGLSLFF